MKKTDIAAEMLCERLDLPEDILVNSLKLTMNGGKRALIENHKGILEYGKDRIVVSSKREKIVINGSGLNIVAMNKNEVLLSGKIESVEWN